MDVKRIKGMNDILPDEVMKWRHIEDTCRKVFMGFGYNEIRPPVIEKTELFARSIGESTDIVEKEMYTLTTSKGGHITLRPEATASVLRAYIENNLYVQNPVQKLFTIGPMFRHERPQKGRYRQFHQVDVELLGADTPYADIEIISLLDYLLVRLGVKDITIQINSLGCKECRPVFQKTLLNFFRGVQKELCQDCRRRINTNPLRVLDCKVPSCRKILINAPVILDDLCKSCNDHFNKVKDGIGGLGIDYEVIPGLVRGLDYYTGIAFEAITNNLGAQNAVGGGGRYNGLIRELGGPDLSGIGFALGIERLLLLQENNRDEDGDVLLPLYLIALGEKARELFFNLSQRLAMASIPNGFSFLTKSLKAQMKLADRNNARFALIAGEDELSDGLVILRDMQTKFQKQIPVENLFENIKNEIMEAEVI